MKNNVVTYFKNKNNLGFKLKFNFIDSPDNYEIDYNFNYYGELKIKFKNLSKKQKIRYGNDIAIRSTIHILGNGCLYGIDDLLYNIENNSQLAAHFIYDNEMFIKQQLIYNLI